MRKQYLDTIRGRCPACRKSAPGHVYGGRFVDVVGWVCPRCDSIFDVDDVEEETDHDELPELQIDSEGIHLGELTMDPTTAADVGSQLSMAAHLQLDDWGEEVDR